MRYNCNICLLDIKKKIKLFFNDQDCKYLMTDMIDNTSNFEKIGDILLILNLTVIVFSFNNFFYINDGYIYH